MTVKVDFDCEAWQDCEDWEALTDRSVRAAFSASPFAEMLRERYQVSVSVRLSDDEEVQRLNKQFRGKNKPTNVLSFPMVQDDLLEIMSNSDDGEVLLGDIIVAREVATREAEEKGVALAVHLSHLIVHGTFHLLGYDHETNDAEAEQMEELETKALASLGIANPY